MKIAKAIFIAVLAQAGTQVSLIAKAIFIAVLAKAGTQVSSSI